MSSELPKAEDVKRDFLAQGQTIAQWATDHGFSKGSVYAVLDGRCKGHRGEAHLIAVALGLKAPPKAKTAASTLETIQA